MTFLNKYVETLAKKGYVYPGAVNLVSERTPVCTFAFTYRLLNPQDS